MKTGLVSLVGSFQQGLGKLRETVGRAAKNGLLVASASLMVSACGGGGGDSPSTAAPATPSTALTTEQKRVLLADSQSRPIWFLPVYPAGTVDRSKSWRWNPQRDGLIPVKISGDPLVINAALEQVEAAIGQRLFDRDLYRNTAELFVVRGIILKTGRPPPAQVLNNCGVAQPAMPIAAPNFFFNGSMVPAPLLEALIWLDATQSFNPMPAEVAFPNEVFFKRQDGLKKRAVIEILVDTSNPNCTNPQALYVHELAHALGLLGHFDGFGLGTENADKYLGLLKMLYSNPSGTAFSQMN